MATLWVGGWLRFRLFIPHLFHKYSIGSQLYQVDNFVSLSHSVKSPFSNSNSEGQEGTEGCHSKMINRRDQQSGKSKMIRRLISYSRPCHDNMLNEKSPNENWPWGRGLAMTWVVVIVFWLGLQKTGNCRQIVIFALEMFF